MTLAPQSASWRTQVGPARTRVRSRTVKRWSAPEALGKGLAFGSLRIVSFCCISCCIPLPGGRREPDIASSLACCARRRGFEQAGLYPLWSVHVGRCNIARLDPLMATPPLILPSLIKLSRTLVALSIAGTSTLAIAQERPRRPPAQQSEQHASDPRQGEQARESVLRLLPADSVTEHAVAIPGGTLLYSATAGTFSLFDQSGERSAAVYYTAYVAKNADAASRPVTFAFNGGPGAASAYLNLGLVGPRILEFPGNDAAAARMRDNPATWLAFTDLVMIDPVGAGWSRPAKPDGGNAFYGVRQDAQAMAKVVALYLAKNGRSSSPK